MWHPGGRYEVVRPIALHTKPDQSSAVRGELRPGCRALLMALDKCPAPEGQGKILVAYLADTRKANWTSGWASLGHVQGDVVSPRSSQSSGEPPLKLGRRRGSWELGGRYSLLNKVMLRKQVELQSETICELQRHEEVLILELGVVIRDGEPRLRACVRADSGLYGWLTVAMSGAVPSMDPLNLLSAAAATPSFLGCAPAARRRRAGVSRITVSGCKELEAWEVGGKYRTLTKACLRKEAELDSQAVVSLKAGTLVLVEELRKVQWHPSVEGSLRLRVAVDAGPEAPDMRGWISSTNSYGEEVLDVRDQLEYEKLLHGQLVPLQEPWSHCETLSIILRLPRPPGGCPLGLAVDNSDGKTLLVESITAEGLVARWNASQASCPLLPGDRILRVNGVEGDAAALLRQMSSQTLEVVLQRCTNAPVGGACGSSGPACPIVGPLEAFGMAMPSAHGPPRLALAQANEGDVEQQAFSHLGSRTNNASIPPRPGRGRWAVLPEAGAPQRQLLDSTTTTSGWQEPSRGDARLLGQSDDEDWRPASDEDETSLGLDEAAWGGATELMRYSAAVDLGFSFDPGRDLEEHWAGSDRGPAQPPAKLPPSLQGRTTQAGAHAGNDADRDWRPVGVCIQEVPDWRLYADPSQKDAEADNECHCQPCREDGFLALLACGPGDGFDERRRALPSVPPFPAPLPASLVPPTSPSGGFVTAAPASATSAPCMVAPPPLTTLRFRQAPATPARLPTMPAPQRLPVSQAPRG